MAVTAKRAERGAKQVGREIAAREAKVAVFPGAAESEGVELAKGGAYYDTPLGRFQRSLPTLGALHWVMLGPALHLVPKAAAR